MNPYWGTNFFTFWGVFCKRLPLLLMGKTQLASDEIQLFVLFLIAALCGLVGIFLHLRKMSMMANSLSHTVLLGIVCAFLLFRSAEGAIIIDVKILLIGALISSFLTAFLTEFLTKVLHLQKDASIGLVFTGLFALGIVLVTLFTKNVHIGSEAVMGNVDALHVHDLLPLLYLALGTFGVIFLFYHKFKITTFDAVFAKTLGISGAFFHYLLLFLTAATVIGSFRAVGVILVLAFLVAPCLSARLLSKKLLYLLFLSPVLGMIASSLGVALSRHLLSVHSFPVSTGALVAVILTVQYFLIFGGKRILTFVRIPIRI